MRFIRQRRFATGYATGYATGMQLVCNWYVIARTRTGPAAAKSASRARDKSLATRKSVCRGLEPRCRCPHQEPAPNEGSMSETREQSTPVRAKKTPILTKHWRCETHPPPPPMSMLPLTHRPLRTEMGVFFATAPPPHTPTSTLTFGVRGFDLASRIFEDGRFFRSHRICGSTT